MKENRTYNPLDESIRRSYDTWQPEVPEQVWDTLEESILLEQVWDKLESSLHIEQVWDKLDHSLTKQQNRFRIIRNSLSLATLLFISFFISDSIENKTIKFPYTGNTHTAHAGILTTENFPHNDQKSGSQAPILNAVNSISKSKTSDFIASETRQTENTVATGSSTELKEIPELKLRTVRSSIPTSTWQINRFAQPLTSFSKHELENERRLRYGIYFAAQASRFNWNNSRPINTYHPEAGYEAGISLLYRFNHFYLGFQAGVSLLCQSEKHYINGKYSTVDYDLNTATIRVPVSVPIYHKLEVQAAANALIPYQSIGKNESKIVELPRMSGFYPGFSTGINYRLNRFAAINLSYGVNYPAGANSTSIRSIQQVQCQFSVHF